MGGASRRDHAARGRGHELLQANRPAAASYTAGSRRHLRCDLYAGEIFHGQGAVGCESVAACEPGRATEGAWLGGSKNGATSTHVLWALPAAHLQSVQPHS